VHIGVGVVLPEVLRAAVGHVRRGEGEDEAEEEEQAEEYGAVNKYKVVQLYPSLYSSCTSASCAGPFL